MIKSEMVAWAWFILCCPWVENFQRRGPFPQNLGMAPWQLSHGLELHPKDETERQSSSKELGLGNTQTRFKSRTPQELVENPQA